MSKDAWIPDQYKLFEDVRTRPGIELMTRLPASSKVKCVYDLGCGTGRFVPHLAHHFTSAKIIGVDNSQNMIDDAVKTMQDKQLYPATIVDRVQWNCQDLAHFTCTNTHKADVIYSNAALHWLKNHETLFPDLVKQISAGGHLAVQIPNNFSQPSHTLIHQTIKDLKFEEQLKDVLPTLCSVPENPLHFYHNVLNEICASVDVWETTYAQVLKCPLLNSATHPSLAPSFVNDAPQGAENQGPYHPVLEFTKGSYLSPILQGLANDADRRRFQAYYSNLLCKAYQLQPNIHKTGDKDTLIAIFPFHRIFIVAQKA